MVEGGERERGWTLEKKKRESSLGLKGRESNREPSTRHVRTDQPRASSEPCSWERERIDRSIHPEVGTLEDYSSRREREEDASRLIVSWSFFLTFSPSQ